MYTLSELRSIVSIIGGKVDYRFLKKEEVVTIVVRYLEG